NVRQLGLFEIRQIQFLQLSGARQQYNQDHSSDQGKQMENPGDLPGWPPDPPLEVLVNHRGTRPVRPSRNALEDAPRTKLLQNLVAGRLIARGEGDAIYFVQRSRRMHLKEFDGLQNSFLGDLGHPQAAVAGSEQWDQNRFVRIAQDLSTQEALVLSVHGRQHRFDAAAKVIRI